MFNWYVEGMKLKNMARDENGVFACEIETSVEDKIAFVDSFSSGSLSHLIALVEKFKADYPTLKIDERGRVKTVSLQAWLRKNDSYSIVNNWSDTCGRIDFMNYRGNIRRVEIPSLVDTCFHTQLERCLVEEQSYFNKNNPNQQLIKKVCMTLSKYGYPSNYCFSLGEEDYISARNTFHTDEYGIYLSTNKADRNLTIEEVKALETALAPVEEKYQQLKRAQAEMEEALKMAGLDFARNINELVC